MTDSKYYNFFNKFSFYLIVVFIFFHLLNHLFLMISINEHINFMETIRLVYRNVFIEIILILSFLFQLFITIKKLWNERQLKKTIIEKFVFFSKIYIVYFLINHIFAILIGRIIFKLDTNIYFALSGVQIKPFSYYFIIYYFFAIISLFLIVSKGKNIFLFYLINILGFIFACFLIYIFQEGFYPIKIPDEYINIYKF
ncbi:hypothetical protein CP965_09300 [Halarcobacter mediterraneus]|uniref:Uncharacterized protein n=1 Tax=Halarcobacter mediterraneus TaxID=2023153 RepID=A0A4Q1AYN0_9BACT|nr:hypothetical protein CP965_09300 [Halarcobacter mediterraneus]